jgi:hypothetical protein
MVTGYVAGILVITFLAVITLQSMKNMIDAQNKYTELVEKFVNFIDTDIIAELDETSSNETSSNESSSNESSSEGETTEDEATEDEATEDEAKENCGDCGPCDSVDTNNCEKCVDYKNKKQEQEILNDDIQIKKMQTFLEQFLQLQTVKIEVTEQEQQEKQQQEHQEDDELDESYPVVNA